MISLTETGAPFPTHIVCGNRKKQHTHFNVYISEKVLCCLGCRGLFLNHFKAFLFFKVACLFPGFIMTLDKKCSCYKSCININV